MRPGCCPEANGGGTSSTLSRTRRASYSNYPRCPRQGSIGPFIVAGSRSVLQAAYIEADQEINAPDPGMSHFLATEPLLGTIPEPRRRHLSQADCPFVGGCPSTTETRRDHSPHATMPTERTLPAAVELESVGAGVKRLPPVAKRIVSAGASLNSSACAAT